MNTRRPLALVLAAAAAVVLSGCTASPSAGPETGEEHVFVVYSAWVENGKIDAISYTFNTPGDGALEKVERPAATGWSIRTTVLNDRTVTVTPADEGVAHCVISAPSKKAVLTTKSGTPGAPVTCDATIGG